MSGLGALTDLELDHLDLVVGGNAGEFLRVKAAVAMATAEIARADLPDDVAAVLAMIGADTTFAGVMREAALLRARVQRAHRIGTECSETHRRDIEDGRGIGPGAI